MKVIENQVSDLMHEPDYAKWMNPLMPDETVLDFRDMRDLLSYISAAPELSPSLQWLSSRDRIPKLKGMNTAETYEDAVELARSGWNEGVDLLLDMASKVTKAIKADVRSNQFLPDVSGIEPDVVAHLQGRPDSMLGFRRGQANRRHFHIVVDVNVRCSACGWRSHDVDPTPPSWVMLRGAAVLIVLRSLLRARYSVTLTARTTSMFFCRNNDGVRGDRLRSPTIWPPYGHLRIDGRNRGAQNLTVNVPLYEPGDLPNYHALAFAMIHNDFTRCLIWSAEEVYHTSLFGTPEFAAPRNKATFNPREHTTGIIGSNNRSAYKNMAGLLTESDRPDRMSYLRDADIFVPSIPMYEDMGMLKQGVARATAGTPFESVDTVMDWVFNTLKEKGVEFTE